LRYAEDSFNPNFVATLGVDFKIKMVDLNDKTVKCQIWDTAVRKIDDNINTKYFLRDKTDFEQLLRTSIAELKEFSLSLI
jgi:hypothetical protein